MSTRSYWDARRRGYRRLVEGPTSSQVNLDAARKNAHVMPMGVIPAEAGIQFVREHANGKKLGPAFAGATR
jgi:hypothetical protein